MLNGEDESAKWNNFKVVQTGNEAVSSTSIERTNKVIVEESINYSMEILKKLLLMTLFNSNY